jgi:hypothetical protein
MKTIATTLLFLLLTAASAGTLADNPKTDAHDVRAAQSTERTRADAAAKPTPPADAPTPPEPRKQKRCRNHFKTVGIGCRKPASR